MVLLLYMSKITLKPHEIRFIKEKAKGKSATQAALIATGSKTPVSAAVAGHRLLKKANIQHELQKILKAQGITLEKAVKPITEALQAEKTGMDKVTGEHYQTGLADHPVRLKAADMALTLLGAKQQQADATPMKPIDNGILREALQSGDEVELQRILFNPSR